LKAALEAEESCAGAEVACVHVEYDDPTGAGGVLVVPLLRAGQWLLYRFTYQEVQAYIKEDWMQRQTLNHIAQVKAEKHTPKAADNVLWTKEVTFMKYLEVQLNKAGKSMFQPFPVNPANMQPTQCVVLDKQFISCPCEGKYRWHKKYGNIIIITNPPSSAFFVQPAVVCVVRRVHLFRNVHVYPSWIGCACVVLMTTLSLARVSGEDDDEMEVTNLCVIGTSSVLMELSDADVASCCEPGCKKAACGDATKCWFQKHPVKVGQKAKKGKVYWVFCLSQIRLIFLHE
jgi:hypothetical protein